MSMKARFFAFIAICLATGVGGIAMGASSSGQDRTFSLGVGIFLVLCSLYLALMTWRGLRKGRKL